MPTNEKISKSDQTRQRILRAAREVFTRNSFQTAALRTVAEKAGVKHPLVVHYFKSKSGLFEAVAAQIQDEILESHPGFFNYLQTLEPDNRGGVYLDGIIRQGLRQPDAYRMILLNAVEVVARRKPLPGLDRMVGIHQKILSLLSDYVIPDAPADLAGMFMIVFTMAVVHFAGGRAFHQKVLGLKSDEKYEAWVGETVRQLFQPVLAALPGGRTPFLARHMSRWREEPPQASQRPPAETEAPLRRGEITRQRIIDAARRVFAAYPYDRATIRMIGQVGNFDFSRIHHMFPTKAALFEAVLQENFREFVDTIASWQEGAAGLPPDEVFVHYLQKGLTYCFEIRETVSLLVINIAHYENYRDVSGFPFMAKVHSNMLEMVRQSAPPQVPFEKVSRWLYTIIMMGYTFAGAPSYPARMMKLKPDTAAYRQWVFETLCFVFMPSLVNNVKGQ
ncbi:MAG: TetR/AcrR family transcriptional regulator [Thermodesulfobacteriota bacterium]